MTTTTGYLRGLLADDAVRAGELDTGLIERRGVPAGPIGDDGIAIAAAMLIVADRGASAGDDPFARVDGWRLGGAAPPRTGGCRSAAASRSRSTCRRSTWRWCSPLGDGRFAIDERGEWLLARDGDVTWIGHGG